MFRTLVDGKSYGGGSNGFFSFPKKKFNHVCSVKLLTGEISLDILLYTAGVGRNGIFLSRYTRPFRHKYFECL